MRRSSFSMSTSCQDLPVGLRRIMLLDTASLYFRAFYGVPDSFRAPDGTPINAVRGLLDFISRLVSTYGPSHLACCWDNDWRPQGRGGNAAPLPPLPPRDAWAAGRRQTGTA